MGSTAGFGGVNLPLTVPPCLGAGAFWVGGVAGADAGAFPGTGALAAGAASSGFAETSRAGALTAVVGELESGCCGPPPCESANRRIPPTTATEAATTATVDGPPRRVGGVGSGPGVLIG